MLGGAGPETDTSARVASFMPASSRGLAHDVTRRSAAATRGRDTAPRARKGARHGARTGRHQARAPSRQGGGGRAGISMAAAWGKAVG